MQDGEVTLLCWEPWIGSRYSMGCCEMCIRDRTNGATLSGEDALLLGDASYASLLDTTETGVMGSLDIPKIGVEPVSYTHLGTGDDSRKKDCRLFSGNLQQTADRGSDLSVIGTVEKTTGR